MDELITLLRAREDDRAAKADQAHTLNCDLVLGSISGNVNDQCDCGGPEFVLADVAAKRRIIEHCAETIKLSDHTDPHEHAWISDLLYIVRLLALPYADHPEYREEWRP